MASRILCQVEVGLVRRGLLDLHDAIERDVVEAASRYDMKAVALYLKDHENTQALIDTLSSPNVVVTVVG